MKSIQLIFIYLFQQSKEIIQALVFIMFGSLKQHFYGFLQLYYQNPIFYLYAKADEDSYDIRHPFRYTLNEYRLNRIEYFQRKRKGDKITFKELEDTYWKNKMDDVAETIKRFYKSRDEKNLTDALL